MSVYYITIVAVAVLSALAVDSENNIRTNKIFVYNHNSKLWLCCVAFILIFVSGFRYHVGRDYGAYYGAFSSFVPKLRESIINLDEPGFPLLATVINWFTDDGAVFIFVTAAFTVGSILYITYKYTDTYVFSSMLIILTGVWHGSFNGVRQYFAAAIICLSHRFILDKKMWKYMLCVFIAFLFHSSAIVMVVPYFILRNKISVKNILILTVGSIILLYNYELIFSFIGALKDDALDLTSTYNLGQVNILRVIVGVVPAIFGLFLYRNVEKTEEQTFYLNILVIYGLLGIIGMNSPYLTRINIYLNVLRPLAMGKLITFKDKNLNLFVKGLIIGFFFLFWYYDVSNTPSLNNFKWIWQR